MTARPSTQAENEAALTLVNVIDARLRGDQIAATILLDPWRRNLAPVLQASVELLAQVLDHYMEDPSVFTGSVRTDLINAMANGGRL